MMEIVPPLPLLLGAALALMTPLWLIELLASRIIRPPLWLIPSASMVPELTTLPVSWFTARADKMTRPSGAWISERLSIRVFSRLGVIVKLSSLESAPKFKVIASPPANAIVPCWASNTPLFCTSGASSAM